MYIYITLYTSEAQLQLALLGASQELEYSQPYIGTYMLWYDIL